MACVKDNRHLPFDLEQGHCKFSGVELELEEEREPLWVPQRADFSPVHDNVAAGCCLYSIMPVVIVVSTNVIVEIWD